MLDNRKIDKLVLIDPYNWYYKASQKNEVDFIYWYVKLEKIKMQKREVGYVIFYEISGRNNAYTCTYTCILKYSMD